MSAAPAVMTRIRKYSKRTIAAFMSVWLSGIAFLLVCPVPAKAAGDDYCPLTRASSSHCDRASDKNKSERVSKGTSQAFDCCAFLPAVFDKVRKLERGTPDLVAPKTAEHVITRPHLVLARVRPPSGYVSYVPVRDRIFIRHHVIRI